jgi:hypothetical protein
MKKFIYVTVALMVMSIFIGCAATMSSEQRRETYDLRNSVGESPFVGSNSGFDSRGLMVPPKYSY